MYLLKKNPVGAPYFIPPLIPHTHSFKKFHYRMIYNIIAAFSSVIWRLMGHFLGSMMSHK